MKKNFIALSITTVFSIPIVSLTLIASIVNPVLAKPEKVAITRKTVSQDEVTLDLKVTEANQRPTLNLTQDNFTVLVDGEKIPDENIVDWKSALDSEPKARVLILVDFSGSMKRTDQRGETK